MVASRMTDLPELAGEVTATGYMHPGYAESLAEYGSPRSLPCSGGCLLEREIPGTQWRDAMGCYPLFACRDWSGLADDLDNLKGQLVCVSLVTDPFGGYDRPLLEGCFDVVIPFKRHFVADLTESPASIVSKHHRKYARKAMRKMDVQVCSEPLKLLDEWVSLYRVLIDRHEIRDLRAFSRTVFEKQLSVPGMVALRAQCQDRVAGVDLFFVQGEIAYNHLTAVSREGYGNRVSYALKWCAIQYFTGKARWIDWGGGIGAASDGNNGLSLFKSGWAQMCRPAYLCGRILDKSQYRKAVRAMNLEHSQWFPAYRQGEFAYAGQ